MIQRARHLTVGRGRRRGAIATIALASIGLATGCSSLPDNGSPAAAADEVVIDETPIVTPSTEVTAPPTLPTLDDVLAEDRFVPLGVALERTGLDEVLDGLDDFVLLAPTATAFASSGADVGIEYSTLMNNTLLLEGIMRYHIVADPSTNGSWRTLNGAALDVDGADANTIERVDGVDVADRIPVRNGTVVVMPRLLLPTPEPLVSSTVLQTDD